MHLRNSEVLNVTTAEEMHRDLKWAEVEIREEHGDELGPIPSLNEQIIIIQCTKCSYQSESMERWRHGDTVRS